MAGVTESNRHYGNVGANQGFEGCHCLDTPGNRKEFRATIRGVGIHKIAVGELQPNPGVKMKIYTQVVLQMTDTIGEYLPVSETSFEYDGPIAKCDRAAQAAAKQNVATANTVAGQAGTNAGQERATLIPTLKNDVNNPTGYTANEQNQQLAAAEAGAGGATSGLTGAAGLMAARTRNTGANPAILDSIARSKAGASAKASEGIAADSSKLAQMKRQSALGGLNNMYGQDVSQQMKAMGLSTDAINAEVNAGKSGWLQNTLDTINALKPSGGGGQSA